MHQITLFQEAPSPDPTPSGKGDTPSHTPPLSAPTGLDPPPPFENPGSATGCSWHTTQCIGHNSHLILSTVSKCIVQAEMSARGWHTKLTAVKHNSDGVVSVLNVASQYRLLVYDITTNIWIAFKNIQYSRQHPARINCMHSIRHNTGCTMHNTMIGKLTNLCSEHSFPEICNWDLWKLKIRFITMQIVAAASL